MQYAEFSDKDNNFALNALVAQSRPLMNSNRDYLSNPQCILRCAGKVFMPPMAFAIASEMSNMQDTSIGGHVRLLDSEMQRGSVMLDDNHGTSSIIPFQGLFI